MQSNPIIHFLIQIVTLGGSFNWAFVKEYIFSSLIIQGAMLTIVLSVVAQALGSLIGLALYFFRRSTARGLRWLAVLYIWFFRGTPLVVQILIFYSVIPYLHLVQPLRSIQLFEALGFQNVFMDSFVAAVAALSLNEGAYMAEIVRAGIDSIDPGQLEAARSLGMTYGLAMRRIVLPQAMRVIIPPLGNEFNNMLKSSSLAAFISLFELLGTATEIGSRLFANLELYVTVSFWYLALTTIWSYVQLRIERKLNVSKLDPSLRTRETFWQRAVGWGARIGRPGLVAPDGIAPTGDDTRRR